MVGVPSPPPSAWGGRTPQTLFIEPCPSHRSPLARMPPPPPEPLFSTHSNDLPCRTVRRRPRPPPPGGSCRGQWRACNRQEGSGRFHYGFGAQSDVSRQVASRSLLPSTISHQSSSSCPRGFQGSPVFRNTVISIVCIPYPPPSL